MGIFSSKETNNNGRNKSSSSSSSITSHDRAMLELKTQRDKLQRQRKRVLLIIQKETDAAKSLIKEGKKERALLSLRQKKYQEGLLQRAEGQLANVQSLIDSLDFAMVEKKVFESLQAGTKALQKLQEEVNEEAVDKLMDESRDAIAFHDRISSALSQSLTETEDFEAEEELQKLERELALSASDASMIQGLQQAPKVPVGREIVEPEGKQSVAEPEVEAQLPASRKRVAMPA